jgi:N-acetylmuramoyl-L-alanine amidase
VNRGTDALARPTARGLLGALTGWTLLFLLAPAAGAAGQPDNTIGIETLGRSYGMKAAWSKPGRILRLQSPWTTLEFTAGSREAAWNGVRLFLGEPVQLKKRALRLNRTDWEAIVRPLMDPVAVAASGDLDLIVIDPGHGGGDPGTENRALGLQEKTLTFDVARRLRRDLERRGYRVALTRDTDSRLRNSQAADLRQRAAKANQLGADLFISLHFNALPRHAQVRGVETYTLTPSGQRSTSSHLRAPGDRKVHPGNRHDHWNAVLGGAVHRSLLKRLDAPDRGIKRARFAVLLPLECPAVLVEAGFLTNAAEARKINTASYRQEIAEAIGDGIGHYHSRLRESVKD